MGLVLGIILGVLAAFNRGKWIDFVTIFIAILGVSIPSFVFAALLQKYVAGGYFPIVGWSTSGMGIAGIFQYTALPTLSAAISGIATYSRYMRSSVLDVIIQTISNFGEVKRASNFRLSGGILRRKCYHTDYFYCGSSGSWYL